MRVVICWMGISGYMAACWRALAEYDDLEVSVLALASSQGHNDEVVRDLNIQLVTDQQLGDRKWLARFVSAQQPQIVVLPGWASSAYMRLPASPVLATSRFIMAMDTPWMGTWRQKLAPWRLRGFLNRMDRVVVTGERCWQYARALGVPERKLRRGTYGIDYDSFSAAYAQRVREPGGWPRRFLFTGRYAPVKGIDVLVQAYRKYRGMVADPWPISCCGQGELGAAIRSTEGMEDLGFVQPRDLAGVYIRHGVFVLASRFDPWPLVILEAGAAGLPVIHTEACGSAVELVRPYYNGLGVATDDPNALAEALHWTHQHHGQLSEMGLRAQQLAAPYSAQLWAQRWYAMFRELVRPTGL